MINHEEISQAIKEFFERGGTIEVLPEQKVFPRFRVGEHSGMFIDPFDFSSTEVNEN